MIFVLCLFSHHCLLDIILVLPWVVVFSHGGQSHPSPCSPHWQWLKDLNLRGCFVSRDSCYIYMWKEFDYLGMYFHGRLFIIDLCKKKKKKNKTKQKSALFIILFSIEHMYGCASLLHWVYVLERVRMRAYFLDSSWCIFWARVWVTFFISFVRWRVTFLWYL